MGDCWHVSVCFNLCPLQHRPRHTNVRSGTPPPKKKKKKKNKCTASRLVDRKRIVPNFNVASPKKAVLWYAIDTLDIVGIWARSFVGM